MKITASSLNTILFNKIWSFTALTHTNKDKADIALDDAENNAQYVRKPQYGNSDNNSDYGSD